MRAAGEAGATAQTGGQNDRCGHTAPRGDRYDARHDARRRGDDDQVGHPRQIGQPRHRAHAIDLVIARAHPADLPRKPGPAQVAHHRPPGRAITRAAAHHRHGARTKDLLQVVRTHRTGDANAIALRYTHWHAKVRTSIRAGPCSCRQRHAVIPLRPGKRFRCTMSRNRIAACRPWSPPNQPTWLRSGHAAPSRESRLNCLQGPLPRCLGLRDRPRTARASRLRDPRCPTPPGLLALYVVAAFVSFRRISTLLRDSVKATYPCNNPLIALAMCFPGGLYRARGI